MSSVPVPPGRRRPPDALLIELDGVVRVSDPGAITADRGQLGPDVLALVRAVRAAGRPAALVANGTSGLRGELVELGLSTEFDAVVISAEIGTHKPTREFFTAACLAVRTPPAGCLFVDHDDRSIRGARAAGLSAYRWNGPADLPYLRAALLR